jgi:hypothetical protein
MFRGLVVVGALLLAAGCGSGTSAAPAKTVTVAPTPSISWDDNGRVACDSALDGAYSTAQVAAKMSTITELQDLALREQQLGNVTLIKAWCAKNYRR